MYVNGGDRPARDEFVGVDRIYGRIYDRTGLSGRSSDLSGRPAAGLRIKELKEKRPQTRVL